MHAILSHAAIPMFKKFTAFDQIPSDKQKDALELKDGSWVLPEVPEDVTKSITTLEATVKNLRKERDDFERDAKKAAADLADATRKLEAKEASGQQTDQKISEMLAKWEKDKNDAIAAAVAEKDKQITTLTERVTRYDLDDVLGAAFMAAEGREERRARAIAQAKLDGWTLVDGKPVRKDATGQVTTATPKDYFTTDFKKELPEFYKGSEASGGGAGGGSGSGAGGAGSSTTGKPVTKWTSDERRAYIEKNGPVEFQKLLDAELVAAVNK